MATIIFFPLFWNKLRVAMTPFSMQLSDLQAGSYGRRVPGRALQLPGNLVVQVMHSSVSDDLDIPHASRISQHSGNSLN